MQNRAASGCSAVAVSLRSNARSAIICGTRLDLRGEPANAFWLAGLGLKKYIWGQEG